MNKNDLLENCTMGELADLVIVYREENMSLRKKIGELNNRYQSDCITINQLQTTIDVLTNRYAKLREQVGL